MVFKRYNIFPYLQLILNAKCHAIRDAQILEKDQVKHEMVHEEKRLDQMMEVDRVNAIDIEEEIGKKRKEERLIGAMKIMEQIQENEQVSHTLVTTSNIYTLRYFVSLKNNGKCYYRCH